MEKKKGANGRWLDSYIEKVVVYAAKYGKAIACRKFGVPQMTFYGWMRRPKYKKLKKISHK